MFCDLLSLSRGKFQAAFIRSVSFEEDNMRLMVSSKYFVYLRMSRYYENAKICTEKAVLVLKLDEHLEVASSWAFLGTIPVAHTNNLFLSVLFESSLFRDQNAN